MSGAGHPAPRATGVEFTADTPQQAVEWASPTGAGGGVSHAAGHPMSFSDTSTAFLRVSELDTGLEDGLQTTLDTVSSKQDGKDVAVEDMVSRGLRAQSLSAELVTGGRVSEGIPPEHAAQLHASLKAQLAVARADKELTKGTRINVAGVGGCAPADGVYAGFKRKRRGANLHRCDYWPLSVLSARFSAYVRSILAQHHVW